MFSFIFVECISLWLWLTVGRSSKGEFLCRPLAYEILDNSMWR